MDLLEGDWSKVKGGFRGYRFVWITTSTGRGVGKLGTGVDRNPGEVHVDLSGGLVAPRESASRPAMGASETRTPHPA
jgi:phage replication initiation protein